VLLRANRGLFLRLQNAYDTLEAKRRIAREVAGGVRAAKFADKDGLALTNLIGQEIGIGLGEPLP
jgi:hypothetical protein